MIDPAVCVPIATASMLSAVTVTATDPLEEPPGVRFVSCGFEVHPG